MTAQHTARIVRTDNISPDRSSSAAPNHFDTVHTFLGTPLAITSEQIALGAQAEIVRTTDPTKVAKIMVKQKGAPGAWTHLSDKQKLFLQLNRAGIPHPYDDYTTLTHDGAYFSHQYTMKKLNGGSLEDIIPRVHKHNSDGGVNFTNQQTLQLLHDTLFPLITAQTYGLVHRDIKPGNIMLHQARTYLIDWDISIFKNNTNVPSAGTPHLFAPERIRTIPSDREASSKSDVYEVVLSVLETQAQGKLSSPMANALRGEVNPRMELHEREFVKSQYRGRVRDLLLQALHNDPSKRLSAFELYHALDSYLHPKSFVSTLKENISSFIGLFLRNKTDLQRVNQEFRTFAHMNNLDHNGSKASLEAELKFHLSSVGAYKADLENRKLTFFNNLYAKMSENTQSLMNYSLARYVRTPSYQQLFTPESLALYAVLFDNVQERKTKLLSTVSGTLLEKYGFKDVGFDVFDADNTKQLKHNLHVLEFVQLAEQYVQRVIRPLHGLKTADHEKYLALSQYYRDSLKSLDFGTHNLVRTYVRNKIALDSSQKTDESHYRHITRALGLKQAPSQLESFEKKLSENSNALEHFVADAHNHITHNHIHNSGDRGTSFAETPPQITTTIWHNGKKYIVQNKSIEEVLQQLKLQPQLLAEGGQGKVYSVRLHSKKSALKIVNSRSNEENYAGVLSWDSGVRANLQRAGLVVPDPLQDLLLEEINGNKVRRAYSAEFVDGTNLAKKASERYRAGIPLTENEVLYTLEKILSQLTVLHEQRIVYRDFNSKNIQLENGDPAKPRLIDFDYSLPYGVQSDTIQGNLRYLAPEQISHPKRGGKPYSTFASDIYSLTATMLSVLSNYTLNKYTLDPDKPHQEQLTAIHSKKMDDSNPEREWIRNKYAENHELKSIFLKALSPAHQNRFTAKEYYEKVKDYNRRFNVG